MAFALPIFYVAYACMFWGQTLLAGGPNNTSSWPFLFTLTGLGPGPRPAGTPQQPKYPQPPGSGPGIVPPGPGMGPGTISPIGPGLPGGAPGLPPPELPIVASTPVFPNQATFPGTTIA